MEMQARGKEAASCTLMIRSPVCLTHCSPNWTEGGMGPGRVLYLLASSKDGGDYLATWGPLRHGKILGVGFLKIIFSQEGVFCDGQRPWDGLSNPEQEAPLCQGTCQGCQ